jgi:AcrR family transcriptional regulator
VSSEPSAPRATTAVEPMRRLPSQERSRIRVERILDAAGELVAERGYEATTTSLIARRARVSPGSFYQFFADKRAVVQALSARNLETFAERLDGLMAAGRYEHWWDAVEAAFDMYVGLCRGNVGFRAVRFGDIVDQHLLDPDEENDTVVADKIAQLLASRFGVPGGQELQLALLMTVKVADTLVRFAFARDVRGDEAVLASTRRMLRTHLEEHVRAQQ